jgi:Flp pilus assembly secretin CpaC
MTRTIHRKAAKAGAFAALPIWLCLLSRTGLAQAIAATPSEAAAAAQSVMGPRTPDAKQKAKSNRAAEEAYLIGAKLLDQHDTAGAVREFTRASTLAPDNSDYAMALAAVRQARVTELVQAAGKARLEGRSIQAETLLVEARRIDPQNALVTQHPDPKAPVADSKDMHSWISDGPRLAGPIQLKPKPGAQSFHIHSSLQQTVLQVASAFGLKASLDASVATKQVKFDLEDVTYEQAMHVLMSMGPLFAVPLAPDAILVAKDSEENRQKYERLVQETIYVPGLTSQQMSEIGTMIKSVFDIKQLSMVNSFGTLVVRAPESTLRVMNETLGDLIDGGAQVMFDLKLYQIDKTSTVNIGATVPSQAGAYNVASAAASLVSANQSVVNQAIAQGIIPAGTSNIEIAALLIEYGLASSSLLTNTLAFIGGGLTTTGIYSNSSATLNFALNASDTRAIDEIQLRVGDRQSATFRAGSKYPITQSTYSSTIPASATAALGGATVGGVSVASLLNSATTSTIPQVQYEDLGVTLKATPTVQKSGMISIHLDLKIESLAGGTVDNIPVLNSNQFTSDVTVPDGGTAFLVSNMTKSQQNAVTGIPGLSELPGFQSSPELDRTTDAGQLLMVITPRLVKKRSNETAGPMIPISLPANASVE